MSDPVKLCTGLDGHSWDVYRFAVDTGVRTWAIEWECYQIGCGVFATTQGEFHPPAAGPDASKLDLWDSPVQRSQEAADETSWDFLTINGEVVHPPFDFGKKDPDDEPF